MNLPARPVFALLVNAAIYGTCWWPFRHLNDAGLHALWASALVYLLLAIVVLTANSSLFTSRVLARPELWLLAAAAGLTNATFNWGLVIGDVVRVVLLFYLMPVWAALVGRWLLGEHLTAGLVTRIACGLSGAMLILYEPDAGLPIPHQAADWLGLAGGFFFAINNVLLRRYRHEQPQALAFATFMGGFLVPGTLAVALCIFGNIQWPTALSGWGAEALILAVAFGIGNWMLIYGAARVPANICSTILVSEVLFAALSSYFIADEYISLNTLIGGTLIITASLAAALAADAQPTDNKIAVKTGARRPD